MKTVIGEHEPEIRQILTPEGVPIRFNLASRGDRAAAFFIDFGIMTAIVVTIALVGGAVGGGFGAVWIMPFVLVSVFLVRTFYHNSKQRLCS